MRIESFKFIKDNCEIIELTYSEMVGLNNILTKLLSEHEKSTHPLPPIPPPLRKIREGVEVIKPDNKTGPPPSPPIRPENQIVNEFSI